MTEMSNSRCLVIRIILGVTLWDILCVQGFSISSPTSFSATTIRTKTPLSQSSVQSLSPITNILSSSNNNNNNYNYNNYYYNKNKNIFISHLSSNSNNEQDSSDIKSMSQKLREEAAKIRREISSFQEEKEEFEKAEQMEIEKKNQEKQDIRNRYAVTIPILKGDGEIVMEQVDFPPRIPGGKSKVFAYQSSLPLGLILGEHESIPGAVSVDETAPDGNGKIAGIQEGDVLRAVTACQATMETPTWQLIVGGIGQPKTKRFMFSTDGVPFEEVMDAVASNRMDPEGRDVWLVVERSV